jgi:hypothetical protein
VLLEVNGGKERQHLVSHGRGQRDRARRSLTLLLGRRRERHHQGRLRRRLVENLVRKTGDFASHGRRAGNDTLDLFVSINNQATFFYDLQVKGA